MRVEKKFTWGVVRSSHNTESRTFRSSMPYVVSADGMRRIVGGIDAPASALAALHRHAEVDDQRPTWQKRRAA